jgi:hypothetical protein
VAAAVVAAAGSTAGAVDAVAEAARDPAAVHGPAAERDPAADSMAARGPGVEDTRIAPLQCRDRAAADGPPLMFPAADGRRWGNFRRPALDLAADKSLDPAAEVGPVAGRSRVREADRFRGPAAGRSPADPVAVHGPVAEGDLHNVI